MRTLVNAYGDWLDRMEMGDTFDGFKALMSFMGLIVLAIILVLAMILVPIAIFSSRDAETHGSCKIGHYVYSKGRSFVCDEYYPLPQVAE